MSTEFINDQWRLVNQENKSKQSNYSMDFDNDAIVFNQTTYSGAFSMSFWVNPVEFTTNNRAFLITGNSNVNFIWLLANNDIRLKINGSQYIFSESGGNDIVPSTWQNIIITRDNSNNVNCFRNGSSFGSSSILSGGFVVNRFAQGYGGSWNYLGKIDAVSIFDYALSPSQITTLQGSSSTGIGNPMSLSPKPVAYYQLGDKSAFNGADYLVPNIAAEEADGDIATSFSPYALDFDAASSDYINCGDSDDFSFGNGSTDSPFSISAWVNWRSISANNPPFVSKWGSSLKEWLFILNNDGKIRFYLIGGGNVQKISATTLSSNTWYHVTATYDGSGGSTAYNGMNLYINGVKENATNAGAAYNAMTNTSQPVEISRYQANRYFDGKISNASIWNTELTQAQVSEIYNEGVPSNLNNHSAYSNLVSWWQLGSNSSFSTNWTVLDEKGSNNGTSSNMGEDAIVDGVGSYANGLSSGMGGDEVIGDAPYSTANALSVNMDVEDRVTDTPS